MIADLWTIIWKEWKEFLFTRGSLRGGLARQLVIIFVFGVFLPLQMGRAWVETPAVLIYWAWVPPLLVSGMVADSFAGERERHTLETLLSTRLPDRAILYGKVLAAVLYGWGATTLSLFLGMVVVNVAHWQGRLVFFPALTMVGGPLLSLLISGLAATAGVLVSLRAATVRQAAQTLSLAAMVIVLGPVLLRSLADKVLPADTLGRLMLALGNANWTAILAVAVLLLAAIDLGLLAVARARFQRTRLILD